MKKSVSEVDHSYDADLQRTLEQIGIARFVGRISSGVIPSEQGYAAVEQYVSHAKERPFLSRLTYLMLGRSDAYLNR